jgi:hypothetical protein
MLAIPSPGNPADFARRRREAAVRGLRLRRLSPSPRDLVYSTGEVLMSGTDGPNSRPGENGVPGDEVPRERRLAKTKPVARRAAVKRAISRHRLEDFHQTLTGLAIAVFGEQATVVAHLRTASGREWLTFVVDAADPASVVQYEDFLPRERAFWTAYAQIIKPVGARFMVAIRPARGWCRVEALAPMFSTMQPAEIVT